jgi:hypothetical protein
LVFFFNKKRPKGEKSFNLVTLIACLDLMATDFERGGLALNIYEPKCEKLQFF